jgi:translation initiation factor 1
MSARSAGGLVYSTAGGRMCPQCRLPLSNCRCAAAAQRPPITEGVARVSRETKGHGGKTVTMVRGLPGDDAALAALGKRLKAACGSGGTVKDGVVLLQGDHVVRVLEWLAQQGQRAKRAGG